MFTFGERLGISMIVEATCLSAASVTFILGFSVYRRVRKALSSRRRHSGRTDASDSTLFLNLMVGDLLQAMANLPDIKWIADAFVTEGRLCTAQAVMKQLGLVSVAMTSLAIGIHTFLILVFMWNPPRHVEKYIVIGIWTFVAFVIGIPNLVHRNETYYGANGYWCFILQQFRTETIVTHYLWSWFAGISMIILYGMMFLVMRGWVVVDRGIHWYDFYDASDVEAPLPPTKPVKEENRESNAIANVMLFYPAVYVVCVLPFNISRWMYFSGRSQPYQFILFSSAVYALSGVFNLILFLTTRPELILGHQGDKEDLPLTRQREGIERTPAPTALGHLPERRHENSRGDTHYQYDQTTPANDDIHPRSLRYTSLPPSESEDYPPRGRGSDPRSQSPSSLTHEDYGYLPH